jgi:hypothetical protein
MVQIETSRSNKETTRKGLPQGGQSSLYSWHEYVTDITIAIFKRKHWKRGEEDEIERARLEVIGDEDYWNDTVSTRTLTKEEHDLAVMREKRYNNLKNIRTRIGP